MNFPQLASRIYNTPLMIDPSKWAAISHYLQQRMSGQTPQAYNGTRNEPSIYSQYGSQFHEGIALIGVQGVLVNRRGQMQGASDELTSYHCIRADIARAIELGADSIVFDIDSPGGEAVGVKELADYIHALDVATYAVISGYGASAAYYIAAATDQIIISPTSFAGSIGTILERMDLSERAKTEGIQSHVFKSGDKKDYGNALQPISADEASYYQQLVNQASQQFFNDVARYRGISAQSVADLQAGIFQGADAVANGLADEITEIHDFINTLQTQNRGNPMLLNSNDKQPQLTQRDTTQAPDASAPAIDVSAVRAEAMRNERHRIASILQHSEAAGREKLAQHLAFNTDQSPDDAISLLIAAPKQAAEQQPAEAQNSMIDALMATQEQPNIDAGDTAPPLSEIEKAQQLWAQKRGYA